MLPHCAAAIRRHTTTIIATGYYVSALVRCQGAARHDAAIGDTVAARYEAELPGGYCPAMQMPAMQMSCFESPPICSHQPSSILLARPCSPGCRCTTTLISTFSQAQTTV